MNGNNFLLYDNLGKGEDPREENQYVLVFGTKRNLTLLVRSECWFADGLFKCAPNLFTQIFSILGTVSKPNDNVVISFTFIFALLSAKTERLYHIQKCSK